MPHSTGPHSTRPDANQPDPTALPVADAQPPGLGTPPHADGPPTVVRAVVGIVLGLVVGGVAAALIRREDADLAAAGAR